MHDDAMELKRVTKKDIVDYVADAERRPSTARIARDMELTMRTTQRYLAELVNDGRLERHEAGPAPTYSATVAAVISS